VERAYTYELLDQWTDPTNNNSEADYGLVRYDFSWKPAATNLANTISLLKDPGSSFTPSSLDFTINGNNLTNIHHTLLQKRDQSFWFAIWQEVNSFNTNTKQDINNAPIAVTLVINTSTITNAKLYQPSKGTNVIQSFSNVKNISFSVPDEILLLQLS